MPEISAVKAHGLFSGKVLYELSRPLRSSRQFNPFDEGHPDLAARMASMLRAMALVSCTAGALTWLEEGAGAAMGAVLGYAKVLGGAYVASEYVADREGKAEMIKALDGQAPAPAGSSATASSAAQPPTVASFVKALASNVALPGSESRMDVKLPGPLDILEKRPNDVDNNMLEKYSSALDASVPLPPADSVGASIRSSANSAA